MKLVELSEKKIKGIPKVRIIELKTKQNRNIRGAVKIFYEYKIASPEATMHNVPCISGAETIYL
jgi:hypothetical protein